MGDWGSQTLADLADKIKNTMPADDPGKLTLRQSADIVTYILQAGKFPAGRAELAADAAMLKLITFPPSATPARTPSAVAGAQGPSFPAFGSMNDVMRGILFPSSNIIFDVQTKDPAREVVGTSTSDSTFTDRLADVYQGWMLVDIAAVALVESAPLLLTPGRRCENGKPVPGRSARLDQVHSRSRRRRKGRLQGLAVEKSRRRDRGHQRGRRLVPQLPQSVPRPAQYPPVRSGAVTDQRSGAALNRA